MTYQEALIRSREMKKIDIRNRLHKYNSDKYPAVKSYDITEAITVAWTINFNNPDKPSLFDRDSAFYKAFTK